MPERYDPKGPTRQQVERRSADVNRAAAEDPLAELAKMVQGRPTSAATAARGRSAPAKATSANPKSDPLNDLEAELMSDLQASFAAIRDAVPPPESEPELEPPALEREPPPDFPSLADAFAPHRQLAEPEPEPTPQPRMVPIPEAPVIQPVVHRATQNDQPPPDRGQRIVRPAPEPPPELARADVGAGFQLRPTAVTTNPPPPRQPHSRWEQPQAEEPAPQAGPSRFAPPRGAPAPQPVHKPAAEEDDPFADSLFTGPVEEEEGDGAFPLDAFAPARDDDAAGLDDDYSDLDRPRRGRNLMLVAAMLAVVVVGGIGYLIFKPGGDSTAATPPTITADAGPTKITPDTTTPSSDGDAQSKLIYDRINSGDNGTSDTTLVTPNDGTVADVPTNGDSDNAISRVILPGGPGVDTPPSSDTSADTTSADAGDADTLGPRKVRTVIVKPDGTIVSSSATDAPPAASDTTAPPPATDTTAAGAADSTSTDSGMDTAAPTLPAPDKPVTDDTQAVSGGVTTPGKELVITPNPDVAPTTVTTTTVPPPKVTPPKVTPPPTTAPPKTVTTTSSGGPIDLTSTPPARAAAATGGMMVQVSSQRSEETARSTYKDLQSRYPSILGKYQVDVQRAEIADRGVFFRARVGPFSAADAQRLCDDLKSAGGDCLLTKR